MSAGAPAAELLLLLKVLQCLCWYIRSIWGSLTGFLYALFYIYIYIYFFFHIIYRHTHTHPSLPPSLTSSIQLSIGLCIHMYMQHPYALMKRRFRIAIAVCFVFKSFLLQLVSMSAGSCHGVIAEPLFEGRDTNGDLSHQCCRPQHIGVSKACILVEDKRSEEKRLRHQAGRCSCFPVLTGRPLFCLTWFLGCEANRARLGWARCAAYHT